MSFGDDGTYTQRCAVPIRRRLLMPTPLITAHHRRRLGLRHFHDYYASEKAPHQHDFGN